MGEEHGLSGERAEELFDERSISNQESVDLRAELLEEVTRERATIVDRELRAKAYELAAGACRPAEADELVAELARSGELVRLEDGLWTTRRLRELEQTTVQIVERRATENAAPLSEAALKQARREIGKEIHASLTLSSARRWRRSPVPAASRSSSAGPAPARVSSSPPLPEPGSSRAMR